MSDAQLDLLTGQPVQPARDPDALTDRQQLALEFIGRYQPVSSDELGAFLHEDRLRRGGKGHHRDSRCDWCQSEGSQMGDSLKGRGKVIRKKTIGWVLPEYQAVPTGTDRPDAPPNPGIAF